MEADLAIDDRITIPGAELWVVTSRSGGPGGQHVQTSDTRVQLHWCVATSGVLDEEQRARLLSRLSTRINTEGVLQVAAQDARSQQANRELARGRLAVLVGRALVVPKPRRPTRPSRAAKERRLGEKKARGKVKAMRGAVED